MTLEPDHEAQFLQAIRQSARIALRRRREYHRHINSR